jgi:SnoaL-like domain
VTGDDAAGRANLLVSFARTGPADPAPLLIGEVYRFAFQRTPQSWRISRLTSTRTWSLNQPKESDPADALT